MTTFRSLAFVAAIATTGAFASAASASTSVYLDAGGIYNPQVVHVAGAVYNGNVYASAIRFDVNNGTGPALPQYTLWGFCVDLFHSINVGFNYQKPLGLQYQELPFVDDRHGTTLGSGQIQQISGLASLGSRLIKLGDADLANRLVAIQSAIWAIEYNSTVTSANASVQSYISQYQALAPSLHGKAYTIYAVDGRTQGFIIGVPEPQTWAMMILGFGLIGLTLRDGRRQNRANTPV